ncbi:MAG: hypothetical protein Q9210_007325 [Variospora velana]
MENNHVIPSTAGIKYKAHGSWMSALVDAVDLNFLCPIRYIYDYLPFPTAWLMPQPVSLSNISQRGEGDMTASPFYKLERVNSVYLHTTEARLPLHTGLKDFRQNKYWRANEDSTRELLQLFAQDRKCSDVLLSNNRSLSDLAEKQLESEVIDTYSRFSVYMFPEADEERIRLLAQSVILIFIFDDTWESAAPETIVHVRQDFVSRLRGSIPPSAADTPLARRISDIRTCLLACDDEEGNGGAEVLETLIRFCYHAEPPRERFSSVRDYLDYRWEDIANTFTSSCAKFSICSSVDQTKPELRRLLRHIGDHISIVNDMASFEKEKRHFDAGRANSMINLVHVIATLERAETQTAKSMAYAWQLWTENAILEELKALKQRNGLSSEEWSFVDVCLMAASGNLLASVVMSRYGGEKTRVA